MSDIKTVVTKLHERGALHPGDVIAIRGKGLISRLVLMAEGPGSKVSHIAGVISVNPPLILEATHPRVRVRPLMSLLADAEEAYLIHDKALTDEQREKIVEEGTKFSALPYSYWLIILHAFNAAFATTWFTESLSKLAGNTQNGSFTKATDSSVFPPEKVAPYRFRVSIILLSPALVLLYAAGHLRLILSNLFGSSIFALLEGSLLFFVGSSFISSHFIHSGWRIVFSCWWMAWVIFLELNAMVN